MSKRPKTNGHAAAGHNSGSLWMQRVYNSIERDPEIDRVAKVWHGEKIAKETDLAMLAGVAGNTVHNLFNGKTRRPQHATLAKVFGAMGFRYELERQGTAPDYEAEIPKARGEFKEHRATLVKRKKQRRRSKP